MRASRASATGSANAPQRVAPGDGDHRMLAERRGRLGERHDRARAVADRAPRRCAASRARARGRRASRSARRRRAAPARARPRSDRSRGRRHTPAEVARSIEPAVPSVGHQPRTPVARPVMAPVARVIATIASPAVTSALAVQSLSTACAGPPRSATATRHAILPPATCTSPAGVAGVPRAPPTAAPRANTFCRRDTPPAHPSRRRSPAARRVPSPSPSRHRSRRPRSPQRQRCGPQRQADPP